MKKILIFGAGVFVGLNLFGVTVLASVTYNVWKDAISFVNKAVE